LWYAANNFTKRRTAMIKYNTLNPVGEEAFNPFEEQTGDAITFKLRSGSEKVPKRVVLSLSVQEIQRILRLRIGFKLHFAKTCALKISASYVRYQPSTTYRHIVNMTLSLLC
jgi:hypothetical protein